MSGNGPWQESCPSQACQQGSGGQTADNITDSAIASAAEGLDDEPLWTPEKVARRLNVSPDWVRDHSSRKEPRLPVIRLGGGPGRAGLLRYRPNKIEKFLEEMERRSSRNSRRI
jgi:hypothetical protein